MCVCASVRVCLRAYIAYVHAFVRGRACVRACVRACMRACVSDVFAIYDNNILPRLITIII